MTTTPHTTDHLTANIEDALCRLIYGYELDPVTDEAHIRMAADLIGMTAGLNPGGCAALQDEAVKAARLRHAGLAAGDVVRQAAVATAEASNL